MIFINQAQSSENPNPPFLRAHMGAIVSMSTSDNRLVTASTSEIRVWDAVSNGAFEFSHVCALGC